MYFHSLDFIVGEVFPMPNPAGLGNEHFMLWTNTEFLSVAYFTQNADYDLPLWDSTPMAVGLFSTPQTVPVILLKMEGVGDFCHPLNMYRLIGDERGPFLKLDKKTVCVMLVEAETGVLISIRPIEIHWAGVLQQICRHQLEVYASAEQVEIVAQDLINRVPLPEMFQVAGRLNWLDLQFPVMNPKVSPSDN
ncbi:hypothetical protein GCM10027347_44890 [Larkinella harenae]